MPRDGEIDGLGLLINAHPTGNAATKAAMPITISLQRYREATKANPITAPPTIAHTAPLIATPV